MRQARRSALLLTLALGMTAFRAHAASPAAEALFEEGRRLLQAGRTDEACSKLAESLAQELSSGTLLNLALCHETQGKLATAWAEYRAAARLSRQQGRADRADAADERAVALEPKLPRLKLTAQQPAPNLKVLVDDVAIGEGAIGLAVPLDPGAHQITASAPGHLSWTTTLPIEVGQELTLEIPALEPAPEPAPVPPAPTPAPVPPAPAPALAAKPRAAALPAPQPKSSPTVTISWLVGGAGVVAVGVGTAFGLSSLKSYRDAGRDCPTHLKCSEAAISERRNAEKAAWVSNVALGVGLLAVGTGIYLHVLGRSHSQRDQVTLSAAPRAGGGWLGVSSAF
jgi:hypothetical protein